MRDKGIDKGLILVRDDSKKNQRGWDKGFFGFRKMFRDYLEKLNVAFYDTCCPAATTAGIVPVRYNDSTNLLQYFNTATGTWSTVDAGALVSDSITLDDGLVSALALRLGADANNGIYGVSDTDMGFAVEGIHVGGANSSGLYANIVSEMTAASGVTIDSVLLKDGGVSNTGVTQIAGFFPTIAAQALSGAGAVNVTAYLTKYTSTAGAQALTIASGSQIGQRKRVSHVVDGGSGVLTGVFVGGTTITFTTVGEFADLLWTGTNWAVLELGNTATPGTPPALA